MPNKFETCLVEQCAPTLAGIKPGSLFNYLAENHEDMHHTIMKWDGILKNKGIRLCLLKDRSYGGLVFVYRPTMLSRLLADEGICDFLSVRGFFCRDVNGCIEELRRRFRDKAEFPHEVGIFLGYPLHDVSGFIENNGLKFSLCGMWKVYEDRTLAEKLFTQYKKCKTIYSAMYKNGSGIVKLAVSA